MRVHWPEACYRAVQSVVWHHIQKSIPEYIKLILPGFCKDVQLCQSLCGKTLYDGSCTGDI